MPIGLYENWESKDAKLEAISASLNRLASPVIIHNSTTCLSLIPKSTEKNMNQGVPKCVEVGNTGVACSPVAPSGPRKQKLGDFL